jgi:hypothetical protein
VISFRYSGFAGLLLLAGCVAAPQQVVTPPPPVERAVEPPARRAFSFEGALTQGGVVIGTAPTGTRALTLDGVDVPLAADGRFMIGFDRDAGPAARLVATLPDGRGVVETLAVRPRAWDIQRIDLPLRGSTPSATFERIRAPEVAQIVAARKVRSAVDGWRQRFAWPVTGRISSVFGSQRIFRGEPAAYHNGVDIVRPTGTPIVAPADGVVVLATAQPFTLEGNLLIVDHGMGLNSAFLHLSRIDVRLGERVRRGQTIGAIGTTGRSTGAHLHWSLMWNTARVDPALLAGAMPQD